MQSIMHNCKISRFRLLYVCMHVCMYVNKHLHVLQQVAQLIRDVMPEDLSAGKTSERPFLLFPQWEWVLAVVVRSIATPYYVFVSSYVCMYVCMYTACVCIYVLVSVCVCWVYAKAEDSFDLFKIPVCMCMCVYGLQAFQAVEAAIAQSSVYTNPSKIPSLVAGVITSIASAITQYQ